MTVKEFIEVLHTMPEDAVILNGGNCPDIDTIYYPTVNGAKMYMVMKEGCNYCDKRYYTESDLHTKGIKVVVIN
jgi:hypothetical protein